VIALTKVLNYRLATPKQGKWVFGKIELSQSLPEIRKFITVTRTKAIPGRFSVNEIVIDGGIVGAIQFIVGTP
jgi:predicted RNA-binding protein with PUA domain